MKIVASCDLGKAPEAVDILSKCGQVVQLPEVREKVLPALQDAVAYFAGAGVRVDQEFLDAAPNLRVIGSPSTGTDHLEKDLIAARGITLFHIARERALLDTFTATSEMAFALLLSLTRKLPAALEDAKQGIWSRERYTGFQLYGKTLGVLGLGRLGTISAKIGQGFSMNVLACDLLPKAMEGVTMVDFDTILREADVLTVHVHLTEENVGLMNAEAFSKMKPGAVLLNTSRGRIIDEQALLDALLSRRIAGAGLDVIDGEWLSLEERREHPLIRYAREHDNLLISPHIGGATKESIEGARIFMAKKLKDFLVTLSG